MSAEPSGPVQVAPAKLVPTTLKRHSYVLRQVERTEMSAIYAQCTNAGSLVAFEAIRVRVARWFGGRMLEKAEMYPGDPRWGRDAWTFSTYGGRVSEADALAGACEHLQSRVVKLKLPTIGAQAEDRLVSGF